MANIKKQKFICPKCQGENELELIDNIEIPYDMDLKKKVLDNSFFSMHCVHCDTMMPIGYKCTYNDLEQKFFLWFVPQMGEKEQQDLEQYNETLKGDSAMRLARNDYCHRIVATANEMREKVLIFDAGLDDRVLELMKLSFIPAIRRQMDKDVKIMGFYFDTREDSDEKRWFIVFDKRPPMMAKFDMAMYERVQDKWKDAIEKYTEEGLVRIDGNWAANLMTNETKQ